MPIDHPIAMEDGDAGTGDRLFLIAESLAQDTSLFPVRDEEFDPPIAGTLSDAQVAREAELLHNMDIDSYIEAVVSRVEDPKRLAAPEVIRQLGEVREEWLEGPFYAAVVHMDFDNGRRAIGFIAQNRAVRSGEWMPEHHLLAANKIEDFGNRSIPIVSLMDTPGAAADADANRGNQAHSISRLIAEMSNTDVPNLGIVFGVGYSGGAIPLAASNMIMSVRDAVFSTIQPRGLASIARRLNLSWQQCAKQVGLSAVELKRQGNIDAVIDYVPGESVGNLRHAIVSGIHHVEESTKRFVAENPYILEHYRRSLQRYLNPSERLRAVEKEAALRLTKNPTEYHNVFGVTFRYLRYLRVRRRIKATSASAYGRLAEQSEPAGELGRRTDRERRGTYLRWLQDPDKVIYDDALSKAWKNYVDKKAASSDERGRFAQLFLGEPKRNYDMAHAALLDAIGMYMYNRWKGDAAGNFAALRDFVLNPNEAPYLLSAADIPNPRSFIAAIREDKALGLVLRRGFSHEGSKMFLTDIADKSDVFLRAELATELNMALTEESLAAHLQPGDVPANVRRTVEEGGSMIIANRLLLDAYFGTEISRTERNTTDPAQITVLDIVLKEELQGDFAKECEGFLTFDLVYNQILENLDSIAQEAESTRALSRQSVAALIDKALSAGAGLAGGLAGGKEGGEDEERARRARFLDWYSGISSNPKSSDFFRAVEEWKKGTFSHISDTLFTVVTFLFERLFKEYLQAQWEGKKYDGRIAPKNIGRKKDFWNRLNRAYRDLRLHNALREYSARVTYQDVVDRFFLSFEEVNGDLLSSDPCEFPGFRLAIEKALSEDKPPAGVVTGLGNFDNGDGGIEVGVVISNVGFKAGAFDMASAEKFCKLLTLCANMDLPVICFISSGGMQTMEGAGALFSMAAINDRLTRFVRDFDLPVIVFGYGNCTGGAQASFVTHPLVQTYYFSGASIPFAGQIVVTSHLPADSQIANYLFNVPGSMQGLVKHPFIDELDNALRAIDPDIPVPSETVTDVVNRVMAGVLTQERPTLESSRRKPTEEELFRPVRKMLIHARGCTAVKLVRGAHENGVRVVLVQSDPDMESVAADMLTDDDALVCIGGNTPDESYLNALSVISIAEHERVDSLHPGIGFLSESSQFAELVRSRGINFIGPRVSSMDTMGNKSNAINTALSLNVPVVPGSHGIVADGDLAAAAADEIGYPVLIKAVHGGGGKGIQVVDSPSDFGELFHRVSVEARSAFGNGDVYLEKYVVSLRHIEVQILRDTHGNAKVLGLRDCSVQRDKQKIIEESGSTMLSPELEQHVLGYAALIADEVNYVGAGTVEFIFDLKANKVYFMEMNTRLQVEHPVTEKVTGIDIVGEQLRIASGEDISGLAVQQSGYAIEARINAERIVRDASGELGLQPSPGRITACEFPKEEGIDVIANAGEGKFVSPYYDSMIAQVIAHGDDRASTAKKLAAYLDRVRLEGIATNIPLLRRILRDEVFLGGDYDTGFLSRMFERIDADALIAEIEQARGTGGDVIGKETIAIEGSDELKVLAPSTGIFYTAPSPTEPPYVSVGETIAIDRTLCQLEAFKLFTPLRLADFNAQGQEPLYPSDMRYVVTRVNVASGQQVNTGDLLFVVRPQPAT